MVGVEFKIHVKIIINVLDLERPYVESIIFMFYNKVIVEDILLRIYTQHPCP